MITKIENGIVIVEPYGFSPGKYPLSEFTADDLLEERRILAGFIQTHQVFSGLFRELDDKIARAIDQKCNEK